MRRRAQDRDFFTASELAKFCQVDLKTIHNWVDRGEIVHFRTPGRHLRFRRGDVVAFLHRFGYPLPSCLQSSRRKLLLVGVSRQDSSALADLGGAFELVRADNPYDALLEIGADPPGAVVLQIASGAEEAVAWITAVRERPATRHVPIVTCGAGPGSRDRLLYAGSSVHISDFDPSLVRESLEALGPALEPASAASG